MLSSNKKLKKFYIHSESWQYFAFNIWNIESAKAVMDAASQIGRDVILQTSMKVFEMLDKEELRTFVSSYMNKKNIRAYLHLDHCRDVESIKQAIEIGWDSVMIDASDKPLEENIYITNVVCDMAGRHDVLVEAEIGEIPRVSGISDEAGVARLEDIEKFVKNGHMDILAAAIGTAHGLYKGQPMIHYDLIKKISEFTDIPLAIHGGTGLTDETFLKLLSYKNIKKINISTDVKLAYRRGLIESVKSENMDGDHFDPLKAEKQIHDSIESMAEGKLQLLRKEW